MQGLLLIELLFVIVFALGLGGWQLISVSREIARDKIKASEERARHAVGEHRLDDR